ncbi:ComEC/Rec2 family competence protein [Inconstantimicrobium mannanitabidum]|nr:ComEC/Rec2 family competence protein [Clostridium sp. TW13]
MRKLNRPLVSLCLAAFWGIYSFSVYTVSTLGAALLAALFFLLIYLYRGKEMLMLAIIMFFVSFMNTAFYYGFRNQSSIIKIEITKVSNYEIQGELNGRRVVVSSKEKLNEGYEYTIKGNFKKETNIEKGTVGTVQINSILGMKQSFTGKITGYSDYVYNSFKQVLGEKEAGIISSVAFGNTKGIDKSEKDVLNEYGVVHIISVSGFHMSLIYVILESIFGFYISTFVALVYVVFTGAQPAVIRAFLMILVLKVGKKIRKNYDAISALALSALILILYKPYNAYDLGFILSYSSTLSILLFYKKINDKLYRLPNLIRDSVSLTLAAQILSFPIVSLALKNFSLNFILGNLILTPFFTIIVVLGNISIVLVRITIIFRCICGVLHLNLYVIQGAINVLNIIALPFLKSTKAIVCCYFSLSIAIVLYKKGYKQFGYTPIPLLVYFMVINYSFQPKIVFFKERYTKFILVEQGFCKTLVCKKDSYKNNINLEYNEEKYLEGNGGLKLGKRSLLYDSKLNKIYIDEGDRYTRVNWSDNFVENEGIYDIINLESNGGTLVLGDKIIVKSE